MGTFCRKNGNNNNPERVKSGSSGHEEGADILRSSLRRMGEKSGPGQIKRSLRNFENPHGGNNIVHLGDFLQLPQL